MPAKLIAKNIIGFLCILVVSCSFLSIPAMAQPKLEFTMKKPEQFKERQLGSEKMAAKKFTVLRKFFQNNYTHYNYYFNANQMLQSIIADATIQKTEDYSKLLPFYPYALEATANNAFLDSILQTCTAGILLHDLRNSWIDNMYMLMGKAYMLKNHPDSAVMTFQYINYSFAPKEKDGYDIPIGSNAGDEKLNAFSISTQEKNSFAKKITGVRPPSRNDALAWQVRALVETENYLDASSLLSTLQEDPQFPERLHPLLHEHAAYMFYKLKAYDSAAHHLAKSIDAAENTEDKARRWYLVGQMYAASNNSIEASDAFANCVKIALNPILEVYARLNSIRLNKSENPNIIDENVALLKNMARKERYQAYSSIILYAAALIELERDNYAGAESILVTALASQTSIAGQKTKNAFTLGNVRVAQKKYGQASMPYDTVVATELDDIENQLLNTRKPACNQIFAAENIIHLNDSLLTIAAMEEPARSEFVQALSKKLRKAAGSKEDTSAVFTGAIKQTTDLFGNASTANSWYFYDINRKANGFNRFRERWGSRPNEDNWRRLSAIKANNIVVTTTDTANTNVVSSQEDKYDDTDISFDNLFARLPISLEKQLKTNDKIITALYQKALALHEKLEDYPEAIKVYNEILKRRDTGNIAAKTIYGLVHCYTKIGDIESAKLASQKLQKDFSTTPEAVKLAPKQAEINAKEAEATKTYAKIYDLFLQGKFVEAIALKDQTEASIGLQAWTPQLLYLESVYHINQRNDSLALNSLGKIAANFPNTPMAAKAKILMEYLPKRLEIESYLTNLKVERNTSSDLSGTQYTRTQQVVPQQGTPIIIPKTDTIVADIKQLENNPATNIKANIVEVKSPFIIDVNTPQIAAIYLKDIDPTYVNEVLYSLNSNSLKNNKGQPIKAQKLKVKDGLWLILLEGQSLQNANSTISYIDYLRPVSEKSIFPWLDVAKYRYFMASRATLDQLVENQEFDLYFEVLHQTFPTKF